MSTALYRVIAPLSLSEPPPHQDVWRDLTPGELVELELPDAVELLQFRLVRFDEEATRKGVAFTKHAFATN